MLDKIYETEQTEQETRRQEGDVIHGSVDYYDFDWGTEGKTSKIPLRGCGNTRTDLYVCGCQCDEVDAECDDDDVECECDTDETDNGDTDGDDTDTDNGDDDTDTDNGDDTDTDDSDDDADDADDTNDTDDGDDNTDVDLDGYDDSGYPIVQI